MDRDLVGEAWEDIKPHVEDEIRSNEMTRQTITKRADQCVRCGDWLEDWEIHPESESWILCIPCGEKLFHGNDFLPSAKQPYLGQRCHIEGTFGTIIALQDDEARVERDAGGSQWYNIEKVELLATFPAV